MAAHPHLSIGEVLSLLQDEFPDVTISKIRFLESQGLVDPERTPSGYRKFYDGDIERLRWVLRQQREAFLPLKVIKDRLEEQGLFPLDEEIQRGATDWPPGAGGGAPGTGPDSDAAREMAPGAGDLSAEVEHGPPPSRLDAPPESGVQGAPTLAPAASIHAVPAASAVQASAGGAARGAGAGTDEGSRDLNRTANGTPDETGAAPGGRYPGASARRPAASAAGATGALADRSAADTAQLFDAGPPYNTYGTAGSTAPPGHRAAVDATRPGRRPAPEGAGAPPREPGAASPGAPAGEARQGQRTLAGARADRGGTARRGRPFEAGAVPDDDELALEELVSAAGVDVGTVRDLERYGLITPRVVGGTTFYAPEAVVIAHLASAFARHGVEARHLRAYKGAAEREAGIVQQVIMPLIRQRNPEARLAAAQAAEELSNLGGALRAALLRSALADLR